MATVQINREEPITPPVESFTLTLSPEELIAVLSILDGEGEVYVLRYSNSAAYDVIETLKDAFSDALDSGSAA